MHDCSRLRWICPYKSSWPGTRPVSYITIFDRGHRKYGRRRLLPRIQSVFRGPRDRATGLGHGRINRCSSVTELEGGGVDAVPQARRLRAVFEHMAQVGPAVGALDLGPPHEQAAIFLLFHVLFLDRRPETRPAGSGVEFRERSEEHTSELQSPCNLVCRLLLEKKKYT